MCVYKYSAVETGEGKQQRGVVVDQLIKDQECTVVGVVHVRSSSILHSSCNNNKQKRYYHHNNTAMCTVFFYVHFVVKECIIIYLCYQQN